MRRHRLLAAVSIAAAITLLSGCYGPFRLTRKLHAFNGTVGPPMVQEVVFVAFCIVPVYGGAAMIDAIVLNSIEFWTGRPAIAEVATARDGSMVVVSSVPDGRVRIEHGNSTRWLVRTPDGVELRSETGRVVRAVRRTSDGGAKVVNGWGRTLLVLRADELRKAVEGGTASARAFAEERAEQAAPVLALR